MIPTPAVPKSVCVVDSKLGHRHQYFSSLSGDSTKQPSLGTMPYTTYYHWSEPLTHDNFKYGLVVTVHVCYRRAVHILTWRWWAGVALSGRMWRCLEMCLVITTGEGLLLVSSGCRPGTLLNIPHRTRQAPHSQRIWAKMSTVLNVIKRKAIIAELMEKYINWYLSKRKRSLTVYNKENIYKLYFLLHALENKLLNEVNKHSSGKCVPSKSPR